MLVAFVSNFKRHLKMNDEDSDILRKNKTHNLINSHVTYATLAPK